MEFANSTFAHLMMVKRQAEPNKRIKRTRYHILPQYSLVLEVICGRVNLRALCALRRIEMRDSNFLKGYSTITDIREADLDLNNEDLLQFVAHEEALRHGNLSNKSLILASTPRQTAMGYILLKKSNRTELDGGVFSTMPGALEYLGMSSNKALTTLEDLY